LTHKGKKIVQKRVKRWVNNQVDCKMNNMREMVEKNPNLYVKP
jgi:hypothetical protein